jgi:hypothetical protein
MTVIRVLRPYGNSGILPDFAGLVTRAAGFFLGSGRVAGKIANIGESWGEETEDGQLSMYQADRNLREGQAESLAMPADDCLGFDYDQCRSPIPPSR